MNGERFKKRLPKFIGKIPDFDDLFKAEDKEFSLMDKRVNEFILALVIQTIGEIESPEIYLRKLEREYNLPSVGTVEERIRAITLKKLGRRTTTEKVVIELCELFGEKAIYIPRYSEYSFELDIYVKDKDIDLTKLSIALDEIIPAHLAKQIKISFMCDLVLETRTGDYLYPLYMCGEEICGDIPNPAYEGEKIEVNLEIQTGSMDSKNYYPMPGIKEGHKSGEINDDGEIEVIYMQDFGSEDIYLFDD